VFPYLTGGEEDDAVTVPLPREVSGFRLSAPPGTAASLSAAGDGDVIHGLPPLHDDESPPLVTHLEECPAQDGL